MPHGHSSIKAAFMSPGFQHHLTISPQSKKYHRLSKYLRSTTSAIIDFCFPQTKSRFENSLPYPILTMTLPPPRSDTDANDRDGKSYPDDDQSQQAGRDNGSDVYDGDQQLQDFVDGFRDGMFGSLTLQRCL